MSEEGERLREYMLSRLDKIWGGELPEDAAWPTRLRDAYILQFRAKADQDLVQACQAFLECSRLAEE